MRLGIFETVYERSSLGDRFDALANDGFGSVQFDWESAGHDPWRDELTTTTAKGVRDEAEAAGISVPAVSGTYNMAHPDKSIRDRGHVGLVRVIGTAPALGAGLVTLCTGTRNASNMWVGDPGNSSEDAWKDCRTSIERALEFAESNGTTLVVEPEPANVVGNARLARRMLDEIASDHLKIVLDPANVVLSDLERAPDDVLSDAFELLGPDIVFAHAKDVTRSGTFCAAGAGIVPWTRYRRLLEGIGYDGDVIFHTLKEADVPRAREVFE